MNIAQTAQPPVSRRKFMKALAVTGVAGIALAGGYTLYEVAPWLDYDSQVSYLRRPFELNSKASERMIDLVRYASLAANGHNAQPWKFAIGENAIDIYPDYHRSLPVVDPDNRELWISLGCALENLLIAARAAGYTPEVTYPDTGDFIRVRLTADTPRGGSLFDAIPLRQNTRSDYDGKPVPTAALDNLMALPSEPGVALHIMTNPGDLAMVLDYVNQGNLSQYADKEFLKELITWLRFTRKEALTSLDGLFTRCSGNPEVPRWLGQIFVAATDPKQQCDIDARRVRSSSGVVVVASGSDDKIAWIRTGQVYERLALMLISLNIKSSFLNQPIEISSIRSQFQRAAGLGEALPQLLLRFGYANAMPLSQRRPVEQILV